MYKLQVRDPARYFTQCEQIDLALKIDGLVVLRSLAVAQLIVLSPRGVCPELDAFHVKYPPGAGQFSVHLYKVHFGNPVTFQRHIAEITSDDQDVPAFQWKPGEEKQDDVFQVTILDKKPCCNLYRQKLPIGDFEWDTQPNFYRLCRTYTSDATYREALEMLWSLEDRRPESALKALHGKYPCTFSEDRDFRSNKLTDAGNASLEDTRVGDCEDFSHMVCRFLSLALRFSKNTSQMFMCVLHSGSVFHCMAVIRSSEKDEFIECVPDNAKKIGTLLTREQLYKKTKLVPVYLVSPLGVIDYKSNKYIVYY